MIQVRIDKLQIHRLEQFFLTFIFLIKSYIFKKKNELKDKEISEKLSLPIEIDCADLDLILSNPWSQKQEEKLQYL